MIPGSAHFAGPGVGIFRRNGGTAVRSSGESSASPAPRTPLRIARAARQMNA